MGKTRGKSRFGALGVLLVAGLSFVPACSEEGSNGGRKGGASGDATTSCPTGDQCCMAPGASSGVCQQSCECTLRSECEASRTSASDLLTCCDGTCLIARLGECRDNADCGGSQCERLDPEDCFG